MSVPVPWNVVVTVRERCYPQAKELLRDFGRTLHTDFHNVILLAVDEPLHLLERIEEYLRDKPQERNWLYRVQPVTSSFHFQNPVEFEHKLEEALQPWLPALAGHSFHVRMHRRGFKGRMSSQQEERALGEFIVAQSKVHGTESTVSFDDPDWVVAVETVGQAAGLSLWSRAQLQQHELLRIH